VSPLLDVVHASYCANIYLAEGVSYTWRKSSMSWDHTRRRLCLLILQCVARHGLPDLGNEVLRVLKVIGASWKEHHLTAMIEAFCKANRLKEAFEHFTLAGEQHHTRRRRNTSHINIIKQDIDSVDNVWLTLDEMRGKEGVDITAINVIIQASIFFGTFNVLLHVQIDSEYGTSQTSTRSILLLSACVAVGIEVSATTYSAR